MTESGILLNSVNQIDMIGYGIKSFEILI